MSETYDVIVLGGGSPGEHAAGRCRTRGLSVVVVEQELVGGECSYFACMPSKTLLRPSVVLATVKKVPGAREAVTGSISVEAALARRDWMTSDLHDDGQEAWLASIGAALVRGHGRLSGPREVTVETADGSTSVLGAARAVIIATGSSAAIPPVAGLDSMRVWTNREVTSAKEVPSSLIVLGGGPVGVEMAQAWHRLGSEKITIVEVGERLLSLAEPFASELLIEAFRNEGIEVRTGTALTSASREGTDGPVHAILSDGTELVADELLIAAGRHPRSLDIGVEAFGLQPGRWIPTDKQLRVQGVDGDWLYAIGDVTGRPALTHMGKYEARIAVDSIAGDEIEVVADNKAVPSVVFTDPIVSWVGLTEEAASKAGYRVRTVSCPLESVAAASIWGDGLHGQCQLVVDVGREIILGATFVGADTDDLLHAATIAVIGEVSLQQLRHAVAAFPTISEIWLELVEGYLFPAKAQ